MDGQGRTSPTARRMALLVVMSWQLVHLVAHPVPGLPLVSDGCPIVATASLPWQSLNGSPWADGPGGAGPLALPGAIARTCTGCRGLELEEGVVNDRSGAQGERRLLP